MDFVTITAIVAILLANIVALVMIQPSAQNVPQDSIKLTVKVHLLSIVNANRAPHQGLVHQMMTVQLLVHKIAIIHVLNVLYI